MMFRLKNFVNGNINRIKAIAAYTVIFAIAVILVFYDFILNGKVLVHNSDSIAQDYVAFLYYRQYLREFIHNLISTHQFVIPLWDNSIGMGSDILTTLHYYVIGDPINLVAVFIPSGWTDIGFSLVTILKIYLAGLIFVLYALYRRYDTYPAIFGAMIYCFSAYVMCAAIKHTMFLSPLVYFPLVIWGIDYYFEKNKPYLFVAGLVLSAYSNFYFFYMICILAIIYWIVRIIFTYSRKDLRNILRWLIKFVISGVCAILISAPMLLPIVNQLFGASRASLSNTIPILYEQGFYANILVGLMTTDNYWECYWAYLGFTAVGLYSLIVLFACKGELALKTGWIILGIIASVPFLGHVLNGFSYPCDRWSFGISMLAAFTFVKMSKKMISLSSVEIKRIAVVIIVYALIIMLIPNIHTRASFFMLSLLFLTFAVSIMASLDIAFVKEAIIVFGVFILLGLRQNAAEEFSQRYDGDIYTFANAFEAEKMTLDEASSIMKNVDTSEYRFDKENTPKKLNTQMLNGDRGLGFYFSLCNGYVSKFMEDVEISDAMEYKITGTDGRGFLADLCNVKYYVGSDPEPLDNRYVKDPIYSENKFDNTYYVYEKKDTLPLAYTYDKYMSEEKYASLEAYEKPEAMMQAVVVSDCDAISQYDDEDIAINGKVCKIDIQGEDGVIVEDNAIDVKKNDGKISITFEPIEEGEIYFEIKGLDYAGYKASEIYLSDSTSRYDKETIALNDEFYMQPETPRITVSTESGSKKYSYRTKKSTSYCGRHDFIYNIGYVENAINEVVITFNDVGKYTFDSIKVYNQALTAESDYINALNEYSLSNVICAANSIKGSIELTSDRFLCLAIPYSKGFRAYVDGKETPIYRANTMFMGLFLGEGVHNIELVYQTPGLVLGLYIALATIVGIIAGMLIIKVKHKKHKNNS